MSKETTTGDDGNVRGKRRKELTPEQMETNDKFDIGPYFLKLFWDEPFFTRVLRITNRIMSRKIVPTAGVAVRNSRPVMIWNQDFISSLSGRQVIGVLKHECYHLIYGHCVERRHEPHTIWNWATDLSINGAIGHENLPDGGFFPGRPFKEPEPEDWAEMSPVEQQRFRHISDLVASFAPHKQAEWYFSQFMNDKTVKEMIKEAEERKKTLEELAGKILSGMSGGDDHGNWGKNLGDDGTFGDLPEGDRQIVEGMIRQALRDAVNRADGSNSWGSVPESIRQELRSMISTEVPWREVLRQFTGLSRRANSKNSRKKINRKVPYAFPGRSRSYAANIAVYVDQSGSVNDRALELLYGTLRDLSRRITFHFYPFDTEVDEANGFVWKKGQTKPGLLRYRCGGTDFQACVDHAHKNADRFDAMIIMSDGECSKPTPGRLRRAYVIAPGERLLFEPETTDIVIAMKDDAEAQEV